MQTILTIQGISLPNQPIITQKKHQGRPSQQISEQELKEIFKQLLSTKNKTERDQVAATFGAKKVKDAIHIFDTDFGKLGVISRVARAGCPIHKREKLGFGWHGYTNGVRIKCQVLNCTWTTHFEPMIYGAVNESNEESEFTNNE